ncbi:hypothetical protein HN031_03565 [Nocardioides sp. zg-1308]|uniref:hypothetical protein n=1 Tax=Nocardioides sp. zg-1308 TaxID=2736253 RepID=UPI0015523DC4|nr:hypothetical protein [Nocardioides sp. zg-1308]NPD03761.1 hypothetical protein [Nocardioides sp. zg-1308]
MDEHLADQEGELLPYLLLADVARWAQATYASQPQAVGDVVDWLEVEYVRAEPAEKDLIGLGFVEAIPYRPEGAPLLARLGPELTQVADDLGLLTHPGELS